MIFSLPLLKHNRLIILLRIDCRSERYPRSTIMAVSAQLGDIDVEVISNGQTLPLYDDPEAEENEEPRTRQSYIEAVTGATFEVKVILRDTFEMGHCDAARITISFDGEEHGWYADINGGSGPKTRPSQDRQVIFSRIAHFDKDLGQWRSGKLSFGALAISKCARIILGQELIWRHLQRRLCGRLLHQ